jgi:hypothetical protein
VETYREDYWKLAEIEDRFNQLQGALRALASTWTLAAFAGLAVLSQVAEKSTWLAPPAFLAWRISILSVFGLALLWVMDQFVYQRLLGATFVSGLLLEQRHADLPAVRSLMLAGSSGGMSKYLRLFYFAPMAMFLALGFLVVIADLTGALSSAKAISDELRLALLLGSAITAAVLLVLYRLSAKVGARALAASLSLDAITDAVQHDHLLRTIQASHRTLASPSSIAAQEPAAVAQPSAAADGPQALRR